MTDPDHTLVGKAQRGERRALSELYERHKRKLFGFLVRILGQRELAEDVLQEVWIKVMQGIAMYRPGEGSFRAWLFRVASNAAVDRLRREGLRTGPELDAPVGQHGERGVDLVPSALPGPDRVGAGRLFARELSAALRALSDRQRAAVLLRHQQGLSYREVAQALGVAEGTAKTLVHRGVVILRQELSGWFNGQDEL